MAKIFRLWDPTKVIYESTGGLNCPKILKIKMLKTTDPISKRSGEISKIYFCRVYWGPGFQLYRFERKNSVHPSLPAQFSPQKTRNLGQKGATFTPGKKCVCGAVKSSVRSEETRNIPKDPSWRISSPIWGKIKTRNLYLSISKFSTNVV